MVSVYFALTKMQRASLFSTCPAEIFPISLTFSTHVTIALENPNYKSNLSTLVCQ